MLSLMILAASLLPCAAQAGMRKLAYNTHWEAQTWRHMEQPGVFARDVGKFCVSNPRSVVEPLIKSLKVIDEQRCTDEIKALSQAWDEARTPSSEPGWATPVIVAVNTGRRDKAAIRATLTKRLGAGVTYLSETQHCPCLVFKGPRAAEAAKITRAARL